MSFSEADKPACYTLGVIADTHVPDRLPILSTAILISLAHLKVDAILHAGDITSPKVLSDLRTVAPVHAVAGNRDILFLPHLPLSRELKFGAVTIGLSHGHGNLGHYLLDKFAYATVGYHFHRYYHLMLKLFPQAKILVFGHTHVPVCLWENDRLFFNPGAAYPCKANDYSPRLGILHIYHQDRIEAEYFPLA